MHLRNRRYAMTLTARVLFGFAVVSTSFLSGSFQHVGAQFAEEPPSFEQPSEDPALQLEEMELRVRGARIGFGVSVGAFVGGLVMMGVALPNATLVCVFECEPTPDWVGPVGGIGAILAVGGLVGMIVSGITLGRSQKEPRRLEPMSPDDLTGAKLRQRQRELRNLREAHYGTPRRVQWDPAQSRLVF
jgi:hypothetical protein